MDKEEFKYHFLPLKDKMFRLSKRLLNNQQDAEDALQEIYMKLWNNRDKLLKYDNYEALAIVITKNHCFDMLRAKRKVFSDIDLTFIPSDNRSDNLTEKNEAFQMISNAIADLPEQQKLIIQLRDIEGYDTDKIMEITGLSQVNIRVNLSRARKKIRDILVKRYEYEH